MYVAYVDESGDPGRTGGSLAFTVAAVLVGDDDWPQALNELIEFRRGLRQIFGIPARAELKAHFVLHGEGPLESLHLSDQQLRRIFNLQLRVQPSIGTIRSFAVAIDKRAHYSSPQASQSVERRAWEYLLQRLERVSATENAPIFIIHDDGRNDLIRGLARKWRRTGSAGSQYGGSLPRPFLRLIDDPTPRESGSSYFLQLADFAAYAAYRKVYPPVGLPPGVRIADQRAWDRLGPARYVNASARRDGIVAWP